MRLKKRDFPDLNIYREELHPLEHVRQKTSIQIAKKTYGEELHPQEHVRQKTSIQIAKKTYEEELHPQEHVRQKTSIQIAKKTYEEDRSQPGMQTSFCLLDLLISTLLKSTIINTHKWTLARWMCFVHFAQLSSGKVRNQAYAATMER
jgi:hypothetical protein